MNKMGMDKGMSKMGDDLQAPEPVDGEPQGQDSLAGANYTGPEQRCANCRNFDGAGQCNLFKAAVDEQGHCERFDAGSEGEEYTEDEAEEEIPEIE